MKVLITGITGMVGSYLAEFLINEGNCEIHGTTRWRSNREHIAAFENRLSLHECELRDSHAVLRLLEEIRPNLVYHLASQSNVAASWISPRETLVNNVTAQLNVFESMRQLALFGTRVLIPGSSEEYGMVYEHELPVSEANPLRPLSPYAVSKIAQDNLAYQYHQSYGLQVIRTRAFNHTGPRQSDAFVISNFARQIVEIETGQKEPVMDVGNLSAQRDFTDIRDIVKAYSLAVRFCDSGCVYNIGSGIGRRIKEVLDTLLGMAKIIIQVKEDPARMRPSDVPAMICDNSHFREKTGWQPEIPFETTLRDLLEYWRERLAPRKIKRRLYENISEAMCRPK